MTPLIDTKENNAFFAHQKRNLLSLQSDSKERVRLYDLLLIGASSFCVRQKCCIQSEERREKTLQTSLRRQRWLSIVCERRACPVFCHAAVCISIRSLAASFYLLAKFANRSAGTTVSRKNEIAANVLLTQVEKKADI